MQPAIGSRSSMSRAIGVGCFCEKLVPICCRDTAPLLRPIPVRPFYEQVPSLLVRRFRRGRGDEFLEARIAAERTNMGSAGAAQE